MEDDWKLAKSAASILPSQNMPYVRARFVDLDLICICISICCKARWLAKSAFEHVIVQTPEYSLQISNSTKYSIKNNRHKLKMLSWIDRVRSANAAVSQPPAPDLPRMLAYDTQICLGLSVPTPFTLPHQWVPHKGICRADAFNPTPVDTSSPLSNSAVVPALHFYS